MPSAPRSPATALIAAAGSGERLGAGGPKALVELAGRPLIAWCLDAFAGAASVAGAIVAAPPGRVDEIAALGPDGLELQVVEGGASRAESVGLALAGVSSEVVIVHDAARPLVSAELIDALVARLLAEPDAAGVIAAKPLTDTVKSVIRGKRKVARTERRDELWAAQTPQVFRTEALRSAHAGGADVTATDDAMLVEQEGGVVLVEPAPGPNLKITTATDLELAELLLRARA